LADLVVITHVFCDYNLAIILIFAVLARSANLPEANLPEGLYILPSVISFLFYLPHIFNDFSETNYLRIRWTDFCNLYIE